MMGAPIVGPVATHEFSGIPDKLAMLGSRLMLVTGPSGAGKTRMLAHVRDLLLKDGVRVIDPAALRPKDKPAVDLLGKDTADAMRLLSCVGLAELRCFIRRPSELSEGQRARLRLALALARATKPGPGAILIDEFGSSLDDLTSRNLALLVRRLVSKNTHTRFVIASNRSFMGPMLAPDLHLSIDLLGRVSACESAPAPISGLFRFEPGTRDDLGALIPFHYRSGLPATLERVLRAVDKETGTLAGVLAISRPTLNGAWRAHAWPGRFDGPDKILAAKRINRDLRTISRVIVDPRFRGLGVAPALVRSYLREPATPCTEAIASMGGVCPFFASAGMAEFRVPPSARDARLMDALGHAGVERWRLATPDLALDRALRTAGEAFIERELRLWARSSGSTSKLATRELPEIFTHAARSIGGGTIAYAHAKHD